MVIMACIKLPIFCMLFTVDLSIQLKFTIQTGVFVYAIIVTLVNHHFGNEPN